MKKRTKRPRTPAGLPTFCWVLAVVAVLAATYEDARALPRIERYVEVSVEPKELDLGSVPQPGVFDSPTTLTVHVAANCNHGGVVVSATPLAGPADAEIPLNRIWVRLPATGEFVPLTDPVVLTGPMNPGVVDVPVKFRVETVLENPPGKYTGTITFTVGP